MTKKLYYRLLLNIIFPNVIVLNTLTYVRDDVDNLSY